MPAILDLSVWGQLWLAFFELLLEKNLLSPMKAKIALAGSETIWTVCVT